MVKLLHVHGHRVGRVASRKYRPESKHLHCLISLHGRTWHVYCAAWELDTWSDAPRICCTNFCTSSKNCNVTTASLFHVVVATKTWTRSAETNMKCTMSITCWKMFLNYDPHIDRERSRLTCCPAKPQPGGPEQSLKLLDDGESTQLLSLGQEETTSSAFCSTASDNRGEHLLAAESSGSSSPVVAPLNSKHQLS